MEKIKHYRLNLSLRKSLVLYVAVFAVLALILSIMTISICDNTVDTIRKSYPSAGEKYYLTNEQGKRLGDGAYIGNVPVMPSGQDERIITLLELFSTIAAPVYSALCIIAAAFLFYRDKLKKPLANLRIAAEKISNNDLDFAVGYDSKDELGELVDSFEIMRTALVNNFSEMWKQVEERKALNAAFAHDLRTPLTVLKGYNEMLQVDADERTRKIAATMGKHISRMEAYVSSMSSLRRLEDTQPKYEAVSLQPFLSSLQENAQMVCTQNRKALHLQNEAPACELFIDRSFILQVCNNLLANAVRYARTSITLSFSLQNKGLLIMVLDDGKGFDKNIVHKVTNPYFTEEDRAEHFGLGLYICRLLCEHHGGYLNIDNTPNGAMVSAFFKNLSL